MFGKLLAKIKRMMGERESFDPGRFGDPVAARTDWGPAKTGGASYCTHKLVAIDPNRVVFRASVSALLLYAVFLLAGFGIVARLATSAVIRGSGSFWRQEFLGIVCGGLLAATIGGLLWYLDTAPIVFDKWKGCFWKGRLSPDKVPDTSSIKHFAKLEDIHALQLISEHCYNTKRSYYSYELNLVLEDGRRINVVDHGSETKLREDAELLAAFLDKPIWGAI